MTEEALQDIYLNNFHKSNNAKFVPFAGYNMPINYKSGIINEHIHVRTHAGLFDVSHMGQILIPLTNENILALEVYIPLDIKLLQFNKCHYSFILNSHGGVVDDIMLSKIKIEDNEFIYIVYNASRKKVLNEIFSKTIVNYKIIQDRCLIALQGPDSFSVISSILNLSSSMKFLDIEILEYENTKVFISRSGYTGEDGFEISILDNIAENFVQKIIQNKNTILCGLGCRDSLRMEAGLSLYGNELNEDINPIQAGLSWALDKSRLKDKNLNCFQVLSEEINTSQSIKRIGLSPVNKSMLRAQMTLHNENNEEIGKITSGCYSPILKKSIAIGYINKTLDMSEKLFVKIRDKLEEIQIEKIPFVKKIIKKEINMSEKKYTEEHEWVKLEGDTAIVGITDHAQESLGDIVFVDLPAVGKEVKAKEELCVIESVKAASDIYSPLDGEVLEVNENLSNDASIVNQDAENEGWIFKLKVSDIAQVNNLMTLDQYKEFWINNMININSFASRHIGPRNDDIAAMLKAVNCESLDELIKKTVPEHILFTDKLKLKPGMSEDFNKVNMQLLSLKNKFKKTYIGLGYHNTITPSVILRNILENPGWYTAYTPYQPEVSQGRLEMLMNFQQMIIDLTGMDIANASLLDESTAAAEAMMMAYKIKKSKQHTFCIQNSCHPQTLSVLKTRANPLGIKIIIGQPDEDTFGCLIQNPDTYGEIENLDKLISDNKSKNIISVVAADIMSMVIMKSPGFYDADIVIGSSQRFGVPMGFGGPHAAFFATKDEYKRLMPGRLIGVSVDRNNKRSYRMALQTREQHIRREKATSNICTAQALLAIIAAAYAIYHGPERLKNIATTINYNARYLKKSLEKLGFNILSRRYFDTLVIEDNKAKDLFNKSVEEGINFRLIDDKTLSLTIDETTTLEDIDNLINFFNTENKTLDAKNVEENLDVIFREDDLLRDDKILTHPIFNIYHSETEMMRYLKKLENKDIALNRSMIPLGSCTMKLNAASEMLPITLPGFANAHPFLEKHQREGYNQMMRELISMLKDITGFDAISLQPNAGAQGEFAGLLAIKKYHEANKQGDRNICLIPNSAHGTNPASAQMCGMEVSIVKCDNLGNVDLNHLDEKIKEAGNKLAALMITYPSTHGVFEESISIICEKIHNAGGQVYMDGANLNAMVGIAKPGKFGPDVSHMNLHKTFCIPHGGGGPGMGPIGVKSHLENFLPGHPIVQNELGLTSLDAVSAAPWGSPAILPISYSYISMMGDEGLKLATQVAILNANYIKEKLKKYFPLLYSGKNGMVAHECIIDIRPIKEELNISEEDIAKRLIDYGFHAPTMSFPVPGTLMIEPTESESKEEIDRFCTAMISIHGEIEKVRNGTYDSEDNPIKNSPHTIEEVSSDKWDHKYSRTEAVFPHSYLYNNKYWSPVARIDNVYGDRNLFCVCPPIEDYEDVSNA